MRKALNITYFLELNTATTPFSGVLKNIFSSVPLTFPFWVVVLGCSKISRELLRKNIEEIFKESAEKKRKFTETVELQISLKNCS